LFSSCSSSFCGVASVACGGDFGRHRCAWRATLGVAVAHVARLPVVANQAPLYLSTTRKCTHAAGFFCFSRLMQSARCVQTVMPDKTRGVSPDSCAHVRLFDATRGHGVDGYIPRRGRQNTQPEILPSSLDDCMHAGSGNADLN
jgi:hypothetical protein